MRTSADTFSKLHRSSGILNPGSKRVLVVCVLALGMLSACATDRRVAPSSEYSAYKAPAAQHDKTRTAPEAQSLSGFEEMHGDKKSCIASWYGRDFHGRPTASGETFDMFALTCAHKEYPLGTKVKVTNPSNGREVDCIVNDRGPFIEGRDIDLSYAAANKIGLIGPGVAPVEVEPLGRYTRYVKEVKYGRLNGKMVTIQIGSFREEANAARLRSGLELHYQSVYIMQANIGKTTYYRVRVGKFRDTAEAMSTARTLAQEGYSVLITKYKQQI